MRIGCSDTSERLSTDPPALPFLRFVYCDLGSTNRSKLSATTAYARCAVSDRCAMPACRQRTDKHLPTRLGGATRTSSPHRPPPMSYVWQTGPLTFARPSCFKKATFPNRGTHDSQRQGFSDVREMNGARILLYRRSGWKRCSEARLFRGKRATVDPRLVVALARLPHLARRLNPSYRPTVGRRRSRERPGSVNAPRDRRRALSRSERKRHSPMERINARKNLCNRRA